MEAYGARPGDMVAYAMPPEAEGVEEAHISRPRDDPGARAAGEQEGGGAVGGYDAERHVGVLSGRLERASRKADDAFSMACALDRKLERLRKRLDGMSGGADMGAVRDARYLVEVDRDGDAWTSAEGFERLGEARMRFAALVAEAAYGERGADIVLSRQRESRDGGVESFAIGRLSWKGGGGDDR